MARATVRVVKDTVTPKLNQRLYSSAVRQLVEDWLENDVLPVARAKAPKDTSELADSLKAYTGSGEVPKSGGFKTESRKFWYVHGRYAIPAPPRRRSRPYFPRASQSLDRWSRHKGLALFLVQKAISERGTPLVPFVAEAVEECIPKLEERIRQAEQEIEAKFNK